VPIKRVDISAIDTAPVDIDIDGDGNVDQYELALQEIGLLTEALANAEAENERLKSSTDVEKVKARMLEPYVNKVFNFVAVYCAFVGIILFMCAMKIEFELPETILGIISGSTAVSVIGLIGLVITGLFGSKKP